MSDSEPNLLLYDRLTGLPNRTLLEERIAHEIDLADRHTTSLALIHINPFPFAEINSALGFAVGDELLVQFARRLTAIVRKVDTVARLTGDEFALLLPEAEKQGVLLVCQKLDMWFEEPFEIAGESLYLGLNMGVSIYPIHCSSVSDLMRGAMVAASEAKKRKETIFIYHEVMATQASENLKLFGALRRAIRNGALNLNFQPQMRLQTGELAGVEVLSRWNEMEISPGRFIPVAEATGLIRDLTHWMLEESIMQAARWKAGGRVIQLSMNVSARDLLSSNLVGELNRWVEAYDLQDYPLMIEVTESSVMEHAHQAIQALNRLRQSGFGISIDDFGTGYSSLVYLRDLPATELKIDQGFVTGLAEHSGNQKLVKAMIALAHEFDMQVVAEGVESVEELELLRSYGCDIVQGYYISKPLTVEALQVWLESDADNAIPSRRFSGSDKFS